MWHEGRFNHENMLQYKYTKKEGYIMLEQLSQSYFGTTDYKGVLAILAPSDASVKSFLAECHARGIEVDY